MSGPPTEFSVANADKTFSQYKVTEKERSERPPNVTNMNFDKVKHGKFHVKKDEYETFLAHVAAYVYDERVPLGLVERPLTEKADGTRLSPLRIDLDLRFPVDERFMIDGSPKRTVGLAISEKFVDLVWEESCKVLDFTDFEPEDVTVYIMQKPHPEHDVEKGVIKDGVHIFCKQIQLVPELHLFLRQKILSRIHEVLPSECFEITSKTDVYDESVLYKGGWMLHGNTKKGKKPYIINSRVTYNTRDITAKPNANRVRVSKDVNKQLVKILSIRYGVEGTYAPGILEKVRDEFQAFVNSNTKAKQSLQLNSLRNHRDPISHTQSRVIESEIGRFSLDEDIVLDKTGDLKTAAWLIDMLSDRRSQNYDTWVNVGICLRNMSRIEGLPDVRTGSLREKMPDEHEIIVDNGMFNLWVEFSRKSPKYVEGIEEKDDWFNKYWLKFGSRSSLDTMIKRPTLRMWAKNDCPTRYAKFMEDDIEGEIKRVVRSGGTHVDVANLARIMYGDEFICANIKNGIWFQFQPSAHRFVRSDSATTLRKCLSTIVRGRFEQYASDRMKFLISQNRRAVEGAIAEVEAEASIQVDISKDEYIKTSLGIAKSLGQTKFLNDVLTECKHRFYETFGEDFIRKLDTDKNLLCFTNGIYDLDNDVFRDGRPEDMISMTVGYDFIEYDEFDPKVTTICEIFDKIFTDTEVNEYMWGIMASVLCGENWRQEVYFMNGVGANGKTVLANWLTRAMGDYAIKPSVSLLTDKRGNAQNASPETYSLKNKRFVYMEEPEEGDNVKINHNLLKDWSGGGTLRGRPLYGELESFPAMFKLFLSCNEFPTITTEEAMWRRLKVIHFKSRFVKPGVPIYDPTTQFYRDERFVSDDFITDHIPQYMSILIHTYRKYWKNRKTPFLEPDAVLEYSKAKRKESEVVHLVFDTIIQQVSPGEFAARYAGHNDLIRSELLSAEKMYKVIKDNPDARSMLKNDTRNIKKSIQSYLNTIGAIPIVVQHGGNSVEYYAFREIEDKE